MKRRMIVALGLVAILAVCSDYAWAAAPRTGLVAEYLFEGNAKDTSGRGNHGIVYDAVLTKDRFQRPKAAYAFNGTSSNIRVPNKPSLQLTKSLTIAAWINTAADYAPIVLKGGEVNDIYYGLWVYNGTLDLDPGAITHSGSTEIPLNKWVHVAATWDGTHIKYYVNGKQDPLTYEFTGTISVTYSDLVMGLDYGPSYLKGKLDDVRIYNRALTAEEIDKVYHDHEPVIGAFTATPEAGSAPLDVKFTCRATSPNGAVTQYLWDLNGDGITDSVTTVGTLSHIYTANGTYKTRVRVVDSEGYWVLSDYLPVKIGDGPELAGKVEYYLFNDTTKTITIKARAYNWGNVAAVPFNVAFIVSDNGLGPRIFKTVAVAAGLATGQNTLVSVSNTFAESIYGRTISIVIDREGKVSEVDETNNRLNLFVGP